MATAKNPTFFRSGSVKDMAKLNRVWIRALVIVLMFVGAIIVAVGAEDDNALGIALGALINNFAVYTLGFMRGEEK